MTLQASGAIDASDINVELGLGATTQLSLGQASCRTLSGVSSGAIRLGADFYGKSSYAAVGATISSNDIGANCTYFSPSTSCNSSSTRTANPSGGTGSYTYSWSWQSGGVDMTIVNTTLQTCTINSSGTVGGASGTIQCVVSDGTTSATPTSFVSHTWADGSL